MSADYITVHYDGPVAQLGRRLGRIHTATELSFGPRDTFAGSLCLCEAQPGPFAPVVVRSDSHRCACGVEWVGGAVAYADVSEFIDLGMGAGVLLSC